MEIRENHLEVTRTARVFTLGTLSPETRYIWIALHGYAMLAGYFIKKFEHFDLDEHYIIAPEGLSRFYRDGLTGRVGASWMTSESRDTEIRDYSSYLQAVYDQYIPEAYRSARIIGFGFSQGVSTLFRWLNQNTARADILVAWAGTISEDVLNNWQLGERPVYALTGDSDPLIDASKAGAYLEKIQKITPAFKLITYVGGHQIISADLEKLLDLIIKKEVI